MQSMIDILETVAEEFSNDEAIARQAQQQIQKMKDWVEENTAENNLGQREKLSEGKDKIGSYFFWN